MHGWSFKWKRIGAALPLGLTLACACASLSGCAAGERRLSAEEAFALSASALSGTDRYGFAGKVTVVTPGGWVAQQAAFDGQVTGHGQLSVQWAGEATPARRGIDANLNPVRLLDLIRSNSADMAYANGEGTPSPGPSVVRIRIALKGDAAKRRIAEGLRAELAGMRQEADLLPADPERRALADRTLSEAEAELERALDTLNVSTVCVLEAARKSWFPSRLNEETVLEYTWKGKSYRERRQSVTRFARGDANGSAPPSP